MRPAIDSCGWLAYLLDEPLAQTYASAVEGSPVVISSASIAEVYRRILLLGRLELAERVMLVLGGHHVVPVTATIATLAAEQSVAHRLHFADSLIYATALELEAELWTHDPHFAGLPGVRFIDPPRP